MILFEHKSYRGRLMSIDAEDGTMHGEVIGMNDVITFQSESVSGFHKAFEESVDDYLAFCAERDEEPEKPYSGRFALRMAPDLHRSVAMAAKGHGQSLNKWVVSTLEQAVNAPTT